MDPTRPTRREMLLGSLAAGLFGPSLLREDAAERARAAVRRHAGRDARQLAGDEDFWTNIQQAFELDRSVINLNNGGVSPSPRSVMSALTRHWQYANNLPPHHLWRMQQPKVETIRTKLARLFGCDREELAITRNTTESLTACIFGMELRPGDEVLTSEHDYPRMINAFRQREQRDGIVLRQVPLPVPIEDDTQVVEAFRKGLTPRTRVILCSHVTFTTGEVLPVADIVRLGRERGIAVIVDGAHAFAHVPFSRRELDCEYYGSSLHKWLCAPHGTGLMFVRRERIASLWPLFGAPPEQADNIRKFEQIGTHPYAPLLAIGEAIALHEAIGPQRKIARLRWLRDRWVGRLTQDRRVRVLTRVGPDAGGAIATMQIDRVDPHKLATHLWARWRILVTTIDYANAHGVRVSPNIYTTRQEIDTFCEAVEDYLANHAE